MTADIISSGGMSSSQMTVSIAFLMQISEQGSGKGRRTLLMHASWKETCGAYLVELV